MTLTSLDVRPAEEPLGLQLVRALEDAGELRTSEFRVTNPDLSIERIEMMLALFGEFKRALSFYIGDLINFSEFAYDDEAYPNRYDRFVELTGLKFETLRNYAYVCRYVAPSRRLDALSFGHHQDVASFEPGVQDEWLAAAVAGGWRRSELRERMKAAGLLRHRSTTKWTPPDELLGPLKDHDPAAATTSPTDPPQETPASASTGAPAAPPTDPADLARLADDDRENGLRGAVQRLVESAERADAYYLVPADAFDEVAGLVAEE